MKVLLTGATGFLGSHLVKGLIASGYEVVGLKRKSSSLARLHGVVDKMHFFDIEDGLTNLRKHHPNVDVIIHTATCYGHEDTSTLQVLATNVIFPLELIELYKDSEKCCFVNTDTFFSKNTNENEYLATYTYSKSVFRNIGERVALRSQMAFVNMQLEHVYGEYDGESKFTTLMFQELFDNVPSIELTLGGQERDFIYVSDVVDAYVTIIENKNIVESKDNYVFEVGSGTATTIKTFVETIKQLTKADSKLLFGALPYRENELRRSVANLGPLRILGWSSKVDLGAGIAKVLTSMND